MFDRQVTTKKEMYKGKLCLVTTTKDYFEIPEQRLRAELEEIDAKNAARKKELQYDLKTIEDSKKPDKRKV